MQHITVDEVKTKAREYYLAGRLTAQHPEQSARKCVYAFGEYRCGVGAAMNAETLAAIAAAGINGKSIFAIAEETPELLTIERGVDRIQEAHDNWARKALHGHPTEHAQGLFESMIGIQAEQEERIAA
jgi:hypothetical protein